MELRIAGPVLDLPSGRVADGDVMARAALSAYPQLALYRPGIVEVAKLPRRQPELQETTPAAINAVGRRPGQFEA